MQGSPCSCSGWARELRSQEVSLGQVWRWHASPINLPSVGNSIWRYTLERGPWSFWWPCVPCATDVRPVGTVLSTECLAPLRIPQMVVSSSLPEPPVWEEVDGKETASVLCWYAVTQLLLKWFVDLTDWEMLCPGGGPQHAYTGVGECELISDLHIQWGCALEASTMPLITYLKLLGISKAAKKPFWRAKGWL